MVGLEGQISRSDSSLKAFVIPTDEELLIARDTVQCILSEPGEHRAAASTRDSGRRTSFHKWAFHAGISVAVARGRTDLQQQIFHVEYREPQCLGLRKRSFPAGDSILERNSPSRH